MQKPPQQRSGWLDTVVFEEVNQVAQCAIVGAISHGLAEVRLSATAQPAQGAAGNVHIAAEEFFSADAAQQAVKTYDLLPARFANRKI